MRSSSPKPRTSLRRSASIHAPKRAARAAGRPSAPQADPPRLPVPVLAAGEIAAIASSAVRACAAADAAIAVALRLAGQGAGLTGLAEDVVAAREAIVAEAAAAGVVLAPSRLLLRDRLRLEWLASSVTPGRPEERLLLDGARALEDAIRGLLAAPSRFVTAELRLRSAAATARALAHGLLAEASPDLLFFAPA